MNLTLDDAAQITLSGITTGAIYALLLFGILIIFRVSKAVNFAHGQLGMIAAFGSFYLYSKGYVSFVVAVLIGLLAAAAISYLVDRLLLEHLSKRSSAEGLDLVVTLGVMLLLTAVAEQLFGNNTYSYEPLGNDKQVLSGGVFLNANQLVVTVASVMLLGAFAWFLLHTSAGVSMRASAADAHLASSVGLNVTKIRGLTWAFAGLIAGVVGIIVASRLSVDAFYMTPFLIKAFIAGIIGGLDRFVVPLLIALALGIYEGWAVFLIGPSYGTPAVFIVVIGLLVLLPRRFLDERREARA